MKIKKTNTKTNTFRNSLPGSTSLIQAPLHTPQRHIKDEGWGLWSMHNSFSLPLLSSHTSAPAWILLTGYSPSRQNCSADHGFFMGCRQSFLCLLKHLLLLWRWYSLSCFSLFFIPLSFSVLCYLPFLECVFTAVPPALQRHHQLNRLAQLWLTVGLLQRWLELDGTG